MSENEKDALIARLVEALRLAQEQRCSMCTVKGSFPCCDCVIEKNVKTVLKEAERAIGGAE